MKTLSLLAITLATGCLGADDTDTVQPLPAPMVSASRDGAQLDIYELTPSTLAVIATGDVPDAIEGKTPVEIYELIAQTPAPAALVTRQAEIKRAQDALAADHLGSVGKNAAPARSPIANLTASAFSSSYCNPGAVDFDYCWTNRTGNYTAQFFNIKWIHSHVNTYSGTLTHSMSYRGFAGSWNLVNSDTVTGSSYVSTFDKDANGDYEVALTGAAGDGYHLSLHGDF